MTPLPYLNLANCIRSLSICLFWKGGIWCTCSGGSFIRYGLLGMILWLVDPWRAYLFVFAGPWQVKVWSWRHKVTWTFIWGMKPIGWMMHPLLFGHMEDECFLWRHERKPWRRIISPPFPTFGLGGSKRHLLGHDVILGGLGFGGVGWFDDDLACLDGGKPLHMRTRPLETQRLPQTDQRLAHHAKT